jgi:mono/diheme cytochrome c family protein
VTVRPGARRLAIAIVLVAAVLATTRRAGASPSKILHELACTSCHLDSPTRYFYESFGAFSKAPPPTPTGCAQCHVSNHVAALSARPAPWLPLTGGMIARIRRFHAYVDAPSLVTRVEVPGGTRVPRFTACGLEQFLSNPLPRHGGARQSMFPVESSRLQAVLRALGPELEPCGAAAAGAAGAIDRGRELFVKRACVTCHTAAGAGPRLRLGFALLGRAYFSARVRHGTGGRMAPLWQRGWEATNGTLVSDPSGSVTMPAHADLGDADVDALYAYVASDRSDVPAALPVPDTERVGVPDTIRLSLYREVQKRVFDTSCRHCHSPEPRDQSLIESVFGKVSGTAPVELPMTRLGVSPSATLRAVLSPGVGCSDSPLVVRLKARAAEWAGHAVAGAPRGMPMTLPPLDRDAIRLVATWSAAGCPSDHGELCDACTAPHAPQAANHAR